MSTPSQCPHCSSTLPVVQGVPVDRCPSCQKTVASGARARGTQPVGDWWRGNSAPAVAPDGRGAGPEGADSPRGAAGPWGWLALAFGVLGFGIAWAPNLGVIGIALGGLGILLGIAGAALGRTRAATLLALASIVLGLQATLFAAAVVKGYAHLFDAAPARTPADAPQVSGPARTVVVLTTDQLLEAFKSTDPAERKKAVDTLAEMARGVADAVPALTDRLQNDDSAAVRSGFATALGNLGPQARSAYPALLHLKDYDGEPSVQAAAKDALDRIGMPTKFDVSFIVKGLDDHRADYRASVAQTLSWICEPENKDAAPRLLERLGDPDARVKLFSAQALWRINRRPQEVVHTFRDLLHHRGDAFIRAGAAQALVNLGAEARVAGPDLRAALGDENPQVRLYAAQLLWLFDPQKSTALLVVPVLAKLLKANERGYRTDAIEVLTRIGPYAAPAASALSEALTDPSNDPYQRSQSALALGSIGPDAAPAVRALAEMVNGGPALAPAAVFALQQIGPRAVAAVPELTAALKDPDLELRGRAAAALGAIGEGAKPAARALAAALAENHDPSIRVLVARALWAVDPEPLRPLPVLLEIAEDRKLRADLRTWAIEGLALMGSAARPAAPALARLQEEADETIRAWASAALDRIGAPTADDTPALLKALASTNATNRRAACQALALLRENGKEAVAALHTAFAEGDVETRIAAAEALGAIGPAAKPAMDDLTRAIDGSPPDLQGAVLNALGRIGPDAKDALPTILKHVANTDARVRAMAVMAALSIAEDDPGVQKALQSCLKDDDGRVRIMAAGVIWHAKKRAELVLPVVAAAVDDRNTEVSVAAIELLAEMGPAAKSMLPRLTQLRTEGSEPVRKAANDALKKLGAASNP